MKFVKMLKKLPIDLGQAEMKEKTMGKRIAFSLVPVVDGGKALDVGCRDGYWSKRIMEKGYEVESIDVEPHYPPAKKVDVNDGLPYEKESFDLIWCSEVLEHLNDPAAVVMEMGRLLKRDGRLIVTVPNSYFWLMSPFYMAGLKPADIQNDGHQHFFTLNSFKDVLPASTPVFGYFPYAILKFKIKSLVGALSPTFIAAMDKKSFDA